MRRTDPIEGPPRGGARASAYTARFCTHMGEARSDTRAAPHSLGARLWRWRSSSRPGPTQAQTTQPVGSAVAQVPESGVGVESATSVRWNRLATRLSAEYDTRRRATASVSSRMAMTMRLYVTLSAAQYEATMAVGAAPEASLDTAVATASAGVLAALMPDAEARSAIDAALAADVEACTRHEATGAIDAGRRIGAKAAQRLLAWSASDGLDAEWHGTMPTEPGTWQSAPGVEPIGAAWPKARPWVLTRIDQFRPLPHRRTSRRSFATRSTKSWRLAAAGRRNRPTWRASGSRRASSTGMPSQRTRSTGVVSAAAMRHASSRS